jgi:hypothetical protein
MLNKHNIIAIVYDFDGTLSPLPMQEYTVFKALGIKAEEFWGNVSKEAHSSGGDEMLIYLRHLKEHICKHQPSFKREDFANLAGNINYFPGVSNWFEKINQFVELKGQGAVQIEHFIISAGLKEILEGTSISKYFKQLYASEYFYNENGRPSFPKLLITDTTKTQFLFRINKGKENPAENINEHMPDEERRIPFDNIIYIGDGMTDVPCMALTKKSGGHAIAVYNPDSEKALNTCRKLMNANRIHFFEKADYSENKALYNYICTILQQQIFNIFSKNIENNCKNNL